VRLQGENARQRAQFVSGLYTSTRDLIAARTLDDLLYHASRTIAETFQCEVALLLPDEKDRVQVRTRVGEATPVDDRELAVATWVYRAGQPAGRGTRTLSSSAWAHVPLRAQHGVVGVLCVRPKKRDSFLSPDQWSLLDAFTNVVALSLSRTLPPPARKSPEI
jgi:two-component system sensor histidine kinase KdpD